MSAVCHADTHMLASAENIFGFAYSLLYANAHKVIFVLMTDIRDARRVLGLSQSELATKLGVHQTTVSRFETGDLPADERTVLAINALLLMNRPKRRRTPPVGAVA